MKTSKLFSTAVMALSLSALVACSSDEPVGIGGNGVAEADETRYMSIQICAPADMSRAFEHGATNESKVVSLDFIFYDAAGQPTARLQNFSDGIDAGFNTATGGNEFEGGNVSRIWTSVVPVELVQGQNIPSQVICIVNGESGRVQELANKNLSELREATRESFSNANNFVMTNSVYFGQDVLSGQANQRLCATPINANTQLFSSREEADEAIKNAATEQNALVNIYVERLAAKVGLSLTKDPQATTLFNGEGEGEVTLQFVPKYWFMNTTSNSNYITKRYGLVKGEDVNFKPTFAEINNAMGAWTSWNDAPNHRSYWACSPSYYDNKYPMVSDEVDDLEGNTTSYNQKYYTYAQVKEQSEISGIEKQAIAANNNKFSVITETQDGVTTSSGYIYTRETTTAISSITNEQHNPAATVASAVIVGQYTINGTAPAQNASFWVDRSTKKDKVEGTYYANETKAIEVLANRQSVVFADDNGNELVRTGFKLMHPVKATRDKLANGNLAGRLVTIQYDNVPETPVFFYNPKANDGVGGFERVTDANLAEVNAQLVTAGYLDQYYNGHGFYSTPIRHLNFQAANYKDGNYAWGDLTIGELGVVRNHVYNLTITDISGLATGVRSDNQPIVPPVTTTDQYIAMRLNILAWNVVTGWEVEL